ncbi:MAG: glycoside hydrolase family 3 protein [Candidatus Limnocylindria bacterium]
MRRRAFLAGAAGAAVAAACAPLAAPPPSAPPSASPLVRDLLSGMSVGAKVGQLMSVAFHGRVITPAIEAMIRDRRVGGVILFKENFDDAASVRRLVVDLQRVAREAGTVPLFVSIDQEGGAVVRIGRGATVLPGQMALAATPDPAAGVRRAVAITVRDLRAIGVNWNLAPVADVNDEPRNPVIQNRSFGSDPARVADLVRVAVSAYAENAFLCCAKHFPGHGSTTVDSHTGLPEIAADLAELRAVELVPFQAAIAADVPAIMSAHIRIPALDPTPDLPVTLSPAVMTGLLRQTLGFRGITVTDDLEMAALRRTATEAESGVRAVIAGADYLLFRFDESAQAEGHRRLADAAADGTLPVARLNASVTRLLEAKSRFGILDGAAPAGNPGVADDRAAALELARGSITLLRNAAVLPLRGRVLALAPPDPDIAVIEDQPTLGAALAAVRPDVAARPITLRPNSSEIAGAVAAARDADVVVVGTADANVNPEQATLVNALRTVRPTVVVSLRSPYDILATPNVAAYVCAYTGREPSVRAACEVLAGMRRPAGRLPVAIPGAYALGAGMNDF